MTATEFILLGLLALAGLFLSALFSGAETGIYTLSRVRLAVRSGRNDRAARLLRDELAHPNRMLGTLLVGNNLANYMGSLGIAAILEGLGYSDWATIILNALVLTPLLFVFGETLPKDLFRTYTDRWTYRIAGFLLVMRWVFTILLLLPLVRGVGAMAARLVGGDADRPLAARQRISRLIKEGGGAGLLSEPQMELADRALRLHTRRVAGEMIPWDRVITVDADLPPEQRERFLRRTHFTRLPVVEERGVVIGVLSTLDAVLDPHRLTREMMYTRFDLPSDLPVATALRRMREHRRKFAIVIDAQTGRIRGIVTLKDLVEPLTGELVAW